MALDFDYDLGETVRIGTRDTTLRAAVIEYIETQKNIRSGHVMLPLMWHRNKGARPGAFEVQHIEALAQLPIFGDLRRRKR